MEETKSACGDDEVTNLAGAALVQFSTLLGERRQVLTRFVANQEFDKTVESGIKCNVQRRSSQFGGYTKRVTSSYPVLYIKKASGLAQSKKILSFDRRKSFMHREYQGTFI